MYTFANIIIKIWLYYEMKKLIQISFPQLLKLFKIIFHNDKQSTLLIIQCALNDVKSKMIGMGNKFLRFYGFLFFLIEYLKDIKASICFIINRKFI